MKRNTVIQTAAVLAVASMGLAACGGGSSTATEASAAPAATAAASAAASAACTTQTLTMGSLMPQTGQLAFLGGPMMAGIKMAVADANAAGGVNGAEVKLIEVDEGDSATDVASQSVDSLLAQGATAVVGAAATSSTLNVLDKAVSNNMIMVSPSNTGPIMSTVEDNGLYFRTAPSDALQGLVLADKATKDGKTNVAVIARKEPYGEGLAKAFVDNFTAAGGNVAAEVYYDPAASSFEAEVAQIKAAKPDGIVVVSYDEVTKIMQEMIKQGVGPKDLQVYLVDGDLSTTAYKDFDKGTMKGVVGTKALGEDVTAFNDTLKKFDTKLTDVIYGAESYDAANLIMLSALAAGCADGPAIAAKMFDVAGNGGEACKGFAECAKLISEGKDVDLQGETGPLDFTAIGDPSSATIGVFSYKTNTEFEEIDRQKAEVPVQ